MNATLIGIARNSIGFREDVKTADSSGVSAKKPNSERSCRRATLLSQGYGNRADVVFAPEPTIRIAVQPAQTDRTAAIVYNSFANESDERKSGKINTRCLTKPGADRFRWIAISLIRRNSLVVKHAFSGGGCCLV